jgi:hypothetical protein
MVSPLEILSNLNLGAAKAIYLNSTQRLLQRSTATRPRKSNRIAGLQARFDQCRTDFLGFRRRRRSAIRCPRRMPAVLRRHPAKLIVLIGSDDMPMRPSRFLGEVPRNHIRVWQVSRCAVVHAARLAEGPTGENRYGLSSFVKACADSSSRNLFQK